MYIYIYFLTETFKQQRSRNSNDFNRKTLKVEGLGCSRKWKGPFVNMFHQFRFPNFSLPYLQFEEEEVNV